MLEYNRSAVVSPHRFDTLLTVNAAWTSSTQLGRRVDEKGPLHGARSSMRGLAGSASPLRNLAAPPLMAKWRSTGEEQEAKMYPSSGSLSSSASREQARHATCTKATFRPECHSPGCSHGSRRSLLPALTGRGSPSS